VQAASTTFLKVLAFCKSEKEKLANSYFMLNFYLRHFSELGAGFVFEEQLRSGVERLLLGLGLPRKAEAPAAQVEALLSRQIAKERLRIVQNQGLKQQLKKAARFHPLSKKSMLIFLLSLLVPDLKSIISYIELVEEINTCKLALIHEEREAERLGAFYASEGILLRTNCLRLRTMRG